MTKTTPAFRTFEKRLARRIARYMRANGRTPKKKEVIHWDYKNDPPASRRKDGWPISHLGLTDRRAFKNLLVLGYIVHSRNGHCRLTRAGARKAGVKEWR